MKKIYNIKFFLIAVVLLIFTIGLVAQNNSEQVSAPAESGHRKSEYIQDAKFQIFNGEEYVVLIEGDKIIFYDPATSKKEVKTSINDNFWNMIYKGNLGTPVLISERKSVSPKGSTSIFQTHRQTSLNGNYITTTEGSEPIISVSGIKNVNLNKKEIIGHYGETYFSESIPYGWIDKTHLLIAKGNVVRQFNGLFSFDVTTGKEKEILPTNYWNKSNEYIQSFVETPELSPSGKYIIYLKPLGRYDYEENLSPTEIYIYDFKTSTHKKIGEGKISGWITSKEISENFGQPGFLNSSFSGCDGPTCGQTGLTFKLPFKCGEAYRVVRDGECFTPTECGYTDGGFPIATWAQCCGEHHDGKKALDFSDNTIGGTGNNDMPVLAAQSGTIKYANWENPDHSVGAGLCVWILHSDNTYTLYGHMKEGSLIVSVGDKIYQGQSLGTEGCTGSCTGQHIHFARSIAMNGSGPNSRWMIFDELGSGKLPMDERVYISKNGNCFGNCTATTIPSCGGTLSGQTNFPYLDTRATYFSQMLGVMGDNAASQNESAGEKIYEYTINQIGGFKVELQNISYQVGNDLDVFIAKTPSGICSNLDPLKDFKDSNGNFISTSSGVSANTLSTAAPSGKYHIIVDGVNGSAGSFSLKVTPCPDITDGGSYRTPNGTRNLAINASIKNIGCGNFSAPTFTTSFVLSTDPNIGNDYPLVNLNYNNYSIAPNAGVNYGFNVTIPSYIPSGWYYLIETLDSGNSVCESNEANSWYFVGTFFVPPTFNGKVETRSTHIPEIYVPDDISEIYSNSNQNDITKLVQIVDYNKFETILTHCKVDVDGLNIFADNTAPNSKYTFANYLGQTILQGTTEGGTINCVVPYSGIYFLSITNKDGTNCVQKIFVK